ncbi:MAG TPA: LamG-like jellyroll fold domain-containing protein [Paludibacter sp.]
MDASATLTSAMVASTKKIVLGDSPAWPGRFFNGQMSDLRFWNVARSQAQIVADMTSTLTGSEAGLVAG